MFSPYSWQIYPLWWKDIFSLPHVLFGWDSCCLILNIGIWAACLDHLTINGERRKSINRKLSDQLWTLTLAWGVLHPKLFCVLHRTCLKFRWAISPLLLIYWAFLQRLPAKPIYNIREAWLSGARRRSVYDKEGKVVNDYAVPPMCGVPKQRKFPQLIRRWQ